MKNSKTLLLAVVALSTCVAGSHAATIVSQTVGLGDSGTAVIGQGIELDGTTFSFTDSLLTAFTLTKGANDGGTATGYIDVYSLGSADFSTLDFTNGTEVANASYLGSSNNVVDTATAANGASLDWTFNSIALPFDTPLFFLLSDTNTAGSFVGTSVKVEGTAG